MNPVGDLIVDSMFDMDGHDDRLYFKEFVRHFAHFQPSNHNTKPNHINSRHGPKSMCIVSPWTWTSYVTCIMQCHLIIGH